MPLTCHRRMPNGTAVLLKVLLSFLKVLLSFGSAKVDCTTASGCYKGSGGPRSFRPSSPWLVHDAIDAWMPRRRMVVPCQGHVLAEFGQFSCH